MSRELKFRAWDGEQMVSPDQIDRDGTAWWVENSIPTRSKVVMQFTGLRSGDGKEIWEGDVIEFDLDEEGISRGVVRWSDRGYWTSQKNGEHEECLIDELIELPNKNVGNIYETPDLLKP